MEELLLTLWVNSTAVSRRCRISCCTFKFGPPASSWLKTPGVSAARRRRSLGQLRL